MINTEKYSKLSKNIDNKKTEDILLLINENDRNIAQIVKKGIPQLTKLVNIGIETIKNKGRIIYLGSGHSGDLCHGDAQETTVTFGIPFGTFRGLHLQLGPNKDWEKQPTINLSGRDGREDGTEQFIKDLKAIKWTKKDLVIGISASGNTPVTIAALKWVTGKGGKTASITNNLKSEMSKVVDFPISVDPGPEIVSGSTRMKSGTVSKILINMLSTTINIKLGNVYKGLMVGLKIGPKNDLKKFEERAIGIVMEATDCSKAEAIKAIDDSDYKTKDKSERNIKIAITMILKKIDAIQAIQILEKAERNIFKIK